MEWVKGSKGINCSNAGADLLVNTTVGRDVLQAPHSAMRSVKVKHLTRSAIRRLCQPESKHLRNCEYLQTWCAVTS